MVLLIELSEYLAMSTINFDGEVFLQFVSEDRGTLTCSGLTPGIPKGCFQHPQDAVIMA